MPEHLKFEPIEIRVGPIAIQWDWYNEGYAGIYDPTAYSEDQPLLRFTCLRGTYNYAKQDFDYEAFASFCTLLPIYADKKYVLLATARILEILKSHSEDTDDDAEAKIQLQLELMSWVSPSTFETSTFETNSIIWPG